MSENETKKIDWAGFKRAMLATCVAGIAFFAGPILATFVFHSGVAVLVVGVVCFVILIRQILKLGTLVCPNCGNPFFYKGQYGNLLSFRCKHCGISIGQTANKSSADQNI